ncbi:hypothetical protein [Roseateles sp. BYS78W]|uniref:hypothetical protein n=1 Tax=Pelomonas candidula TaxID=3299025 RepID=UPI0037494667
MLIQFWHQIGRLDERNSQDFPFFSLRNKYAVYPRKVFAHGGEVLHVVLSRAEMKVVLIGDAHLVFVPFACVGVYAIASLVRCGKPMPQSMRQQDFSDTAFGYGVPQLRCVNRGKQIVNAMNDVVVFVH